MRACVVNLGCKVNRVESDGFEALLAAAGYDLGSPQESDLIIVNTCTVTGEAEKKTRKAVRKALRQSADAPVLVTGCAAVIDPDEFADMDGRVVVVPKHQMVNAIQAYVDFDLADTSRTLAIPSRVRVGLKAQDGCDNACTFCIVHIARGPARSVDASSLIKRACQLAAEGVSEIVLTGINLGSYRASDGADLALLLERLLAATASFQVRFRISSIEPQDVSDDLIALLADAQGRVCRHLHLPLQAGSDRVLREMARHYRAADYEALVDRIRTRVPALSLTTDVIAGFPGETEEDFQQTLALAQRCAFSKMHVFPYSVRTGTPAATRRDQVPPDMRIARARALRRLSDELRRADRARRAGTHEMVVVEELGHGCTESYHEVALDPRIPVGSMVEYCFGVQ